VGVKIVLSHRGIKKKRSETFCTNRLYPVSVIGITKYYSGHQIKTNDVGGTCGTYEEERFTHGIVGGDLRERNHLEDLGVDGRITLQWIFKQ
jgi:hypothetical protein